MEITSKFAVRYSNRLCSFHVIHECSILIDLDSHIFVSENPQDVFSLFWLILDNVVVDKCQIFTKDREGKLKISLVKKHILSQVLW